jgi:hypothetical protein
MNRMFVRERVSVLVVVLALACLVTSSVWAAEDGVQMVVSENVADYNVGDKVGGKELAVDDRGVKYLDGFDAVFGQEYTGKIVIEVTVALTEATTNWADAPCARLKTDRAARGVFWGSTGEFRIITDVPNNKLQTMAAGLWIGEWHDVRLELDTDKQVYDVYFDGALVVDNVDFEKPVSAVDRIAVRNDIRVSQVKVWVE